MRIPYSAGSVAVAAGPEGNLWLAHLREQVTAVGLTDHRPAALNVSADESAAGGRLPRSAVRAVVRDVAGREHDATCGEQTWLAVVPGAIAGRTPVVRFHDPGGAIVAVPLPDGVRVEPVPDADVPCPACGSASWSRVVEAPYGRYGSDGTGRPAAAVCSRCGHEEEVGVTFGSSTSSAPDPETIAAAEAAAARDLAARARAASFQPYGIVGCPVAVVGCGSHGGRVDRLTVAATVPRGRVTIETDADPWSTPSGARARTALEHLLYERDLPWPEGSDTAVGLWLNARNRDRAADAGTAVVRDLTVAVEGAPCAFVLVTHGVHFAAVGSVDQQVVTISGVGDPADLSLERQRV